MRHLLLFALLVFVTPSSAQQDSNTKIWSENNKLTWEDYWAEPEGTLVNAQTRFKIDIYPEIVQVDANDYIQNLDELTVKAVFYKELSWSVDKNSIPLLYHENLRFDIAEIYARKIRRRFTQLKAQKEQRFEMYQREYSKLWKECLEFQKEFERDSQYGRNNLKDQEWNEKIQNELLVLKAYE